MSSTKQKDRVWDPSPKMVTGLDERAWLMNAGMALPSCRRMRVAVRNRESLGEALGLVVHTPGADGIDVPPVRLLLRMDQRIPIDLGGRSQEKGRPLRLRQAQRLVRAEA